MTVITYVHACLHVLRHAVCLRPGCLQDKHDDVDVKSAVVEAGAGEGVEGGGVVGDGATTGDGVEGGGGKKKKKRRKKKKATEGEEGGGGEEEGAGEASSSQGVQSFFCGGPSLLFSLVPSATRSRLATYVYMLQK